jgi:hypothetical protein
MGKNISEQFNFVADELAFAAGNVIHFDPTLSGSADIAYHDEHGHNPIGLTIAVDTNAHNSHAVLDPRQPRRAPRL